MTLSDEEKALIKNIEEIVRDLNTNARMLREMGFDVYLGDYPDTKAGNVMGQKLISCDISKTLLETKGIPYAKQPGNQST